MGVDSWVSSPLFNNMIIALSINIIIVSVFSALPHVVNSQSVLSRQDDAQYSVPQILQTFEANFVGFINTTTALEWAGICFADSKAWLELQDTSNGVATVYLQLNDANSLLCEDNYLFVTPVRCEFDFYFRSGDHTYEILIWKSPLEEEYVKNMGISLFELPSYSKKHPQGYRDM